MNITNFDVFDLRINKSRIFYKSGSANSYGAIFNDTEVRICWIVKRCVCARVKEREGQIDIERKREKEKEEKDCEKPKN